MEKAGVSRKIRKFLGGRKIRKPKMAERGEMRPCPHFANNAKFNADFRTVNAFKWGFTGKGKSLKL
jgi:hypothetical protein